MTEDFRPSLSREPGDPRDHVGPMKQKEIPEQMNWVHDWVQQNEAQTPVSKSRSLSELIKALRLIAEELEKL